MNKSMALALGAMLLATSIGLAAGGSQTFTGVVTDAMCGANHTMMHVTPDSRCVQECVNAGSKYALQVGQDVYTLSDQKSPAKFAVRRVKVTGTLDAKTKVLHVDSIQAAK